VSPNPRHSLRRFWPFKAVRRPQPAYRVEAVFLIENESGLLLQQVSAVSDEHPDADLVAGMLTALRTFVSDSFDDEAGSLRTFVAGDVVIVTEPGPRAYLAAVVRGSPPATLSARLQDVLAMLHRDHAATLQRYREPALCAGLRPYLEACLDPDDEGGGPHSIPESRFWRAWWERLRHV